MCGPDIMPMAVGPTAIDGLLRITPKVPTSGPPSRMVGAVYAGVGGGRVASAAPVAGCARRRTGGRTEQGNVRGRSLTLRNLVREKK